MLKMIENNCRLLNSQLFEAQSQQKLKIGKYFCFPFNIILWTNSVNKIRLNCKIQYFILK